MAIKKLTEHVPIDDALLGDINVIFNKFKKSGLLYRCTFAQLSKHLLSNFLPVRIFAVNYSELRDSYLENIDFEGIKKKAEAESDDSTYFSFNKSQVETIEKALINEVEFHKHICKTYLNLAKEPKEVLLENFLKAQEDLKEIDERLLKIESQLEAITIENNALEKQQRKPVLDYYKTYNLKAKDDILNFIKNEAQDFALSQSYERSIYTSFFLTQPYNYHSDTFEPQFPNSIENKFGELPISQLRKLLKLYKDDKIAFNQYITQHIDNHQIVFQLQALVREHHLLDVRSEIINEALNIYENGANYCFFAFLNLVYVVLKFI